MRRDAVDAFSHKHGSLSLSVLVAQLYQAIQNPNVASLSLHDQNLTYGHNLSACSESPL